MKENNNSLQQERGHLLTHTQQNNRMFGKEIQNTFNFYNSGASGEPGQVMEKA